MAIIAPKIERVGGGEGLPLLVWRGISPGDAVEPFLVRGYNGFAGSVQIGGLFGGAIVSLSQSNDGDIWFPVFDPIGTEVAATTDALFELSLTAAYIKPELSGGVGSAVDIFLLIRG